MDRATVWTDCRDGWIIQEDADLLVVDKPVGTSSMAADPARPDDVVTRLKRFLRERGGDGYLGVHQRLDRDTSGVLVFARRREANARLAAQFEGRTVKKTYRACVGGRPKGKPPATPPHSPAPPGEGTIRAVPPRDRAGVTRGT